MTASGSLSSTCAHAQSHLSIVYRNECNTAEAREAEIYLYWGQVIVEKDAWQVVLHWNIALLEVLSD